MGLYSFCSAIDACERDHIKDWFINRTEIDLPLAKDNRIEFLYYWIFLLLFKGTSVICRIQEDVFIFYNDLMMTALTVETLSLKLVSMKIRFCCPLKDRGLFYYFFEACVHKASWDELVKRIHHRSDTKKNWPLIIPCLNYGNKAGTFTLSTHFVANLNPISLVCRWVHF